MILNKNVNKKSILKKKKKKKKIVGSTYVVLTSMTTPALAVSVRVRAIVGHPLLLVRIEKNVCEQ